MKKLIIHLYVFFFFFFLLPYLLFLACLKSHSSAYCSGAPHLSFSSFIFLHWFWIGHGVFLNDFCWVQDWLVLCSTVVWCGGSLSPLSMALLGPSPWRLSSNITWPSQVGCRQPHQEHTLKSTGAAADTVSCAPPPHCFYCYLSCLLPRMTQGEAMMYSNGFGEGCLAKGEMYL